MLNTVPIFIVDDHVAIRRGLHALLGSRAGWKIAGEACDGHQALEAVRRLQPALIVTDITMPHLNGLDAIPRMLRAAPKSRILVLTMHDEEELIQRSLDVGASAFVLKSDDEGTLIRAVELALRGKRFVSPSVSRIVLNSEDRRRRVNATARPRLLTTREQEVVQLLAEGYSNKQVAGMLTISIRTAENHRARLSKKLGITSLSGLVRYAIRNHMIEP